MRKKYIKCMIATVLSTMIMVSCNFKEEVVTVIESDDVSVRDKTIEELAGKNTELENNLREKENEVESYKVRIAEIEKMYEEKSKELEVLKSEEIIEESYYKWGKSLRDKIEFIHKNAMGDKLTLMPVYNFSNGDRISESEVADWVIVGEFDSLESKLSRIVEEVNRRYFPKSTMEFVKILEIGNEKIALIDFGGIEELEGEYFGGTTGSVISDKKIKYNILQPEYLGEWIDGIRMMNGDERFLVNHSTLWTDVYRDEIMYKDDLVIEDLIGEVGKRYKYSFGENEEALTREIRRYEDGELDVFIKDNNESSYRYKIQDTVMYKVFSNKGDNWEGNGFADGDVIIRGPIKVGATWVKDGYISMITEIEKYSFIGENEYENVVTISRLYNNGDFRRDYYAKGIGLIMSELEDGEYILKSIEDIK